MNFYIGGTIPQARIDPPAQSHASYEASALPTSHHTQLDISEPLFVLQIQAGSE